MPFDEDYGQYENAFDGSGSDSQTQEPPASQNQSGNGAPKDNNFQDKYSIVFHKARSNFDANDPKTHGTVLSFELVQYDKYNCVFITMARQIAAQTQQAGSNIWGWKAEGKFLKFKCGVGDLQNILLLLTFTDPTISLFHRSGGDNTPATTLMGQIYGMVAATDTKVAEAVNLYLKGDSSKNIAPRKTGFHPKSGSLTLTRGDSRYHVVLQAHEIIGLRIYVEEALKRMYGKR